MMGNRLPLSGIIHDSFQNLNGDGVISYKDILKKEE